MSEIKWEEPPPKARRHERVHWQEVVEELRARPGEWAFVGTYLDRASADSSANNVRRGIYRAVRPAGDFEAVARTVDGEYRVYARYVGEVPA